MTNNHLHINLTALLLAVLALVGCSHYNAADDIADDTATNVEAEGNILMLRIAMAVPAGHTRATGNPKGGEQGDGWRVGRHNENNIHDVYLYKYSSADGINASDDTPVTLLAFQKGVDFKPQASDADDKGTITKDIEFNVGTYLYESSNNDHFIACINTDLFGENTTLGKLRNELISYTCRQRGTLMGDYDYFTMSNAHDSKFTGGTGTESDPYIVEIDVERTTARLDFAYSQTAKTSGAFRIDNGTYIYKVEGTSGDEVILTHVRATNVMQAPPYLIKRLAATSSEAPDYLLDETAPATKYVVEPNTWSKTITAADNGDLNFSYWFRDSWYKTAQGSYNTTWFRDQDRVHCGTGGDAFTDGTSLDEKDNDWQYYVLSYANENTMVDAQTHQHYTTGLILKATYKPGAVYGSLDGSSNPVADGSYTTGADFWRCHLIDTNEDLFFSNPETAEAYKVLHPQSVIYKYTGAQCYYNVWLRHENIIDDPTTTMMEFGIVRNNIYRVCVDFTGVGMPDLPTDMTTPETIRMYIFVRKWNLIKHPDIEI